MACDMIQLSPNKIIRLSNILMVISLGQYTLSHPAMAEDKFNLSFIHGDNNATKIQSMREGDDIIPGKYPTDIYLNNQRVDHRVLSFAREHPQDKILPCITAGLYRNYGVIMPAEYSLAKEEVCFDIAAQRPGAILIADPAKQRVDITVPQLFMVSHAQGALPASVYDDGINAGFVNYSFSGNRNTYNNNANHNVSEYAFISVNSGVNIGSWRFRNNSVYSKRSSWSGKGKNIASWAETDLTALQSRLTVGKTSTGSDVFDSVQFMGIQVSSAKEMLPDSLTGYAPVVRGVATSNARVDVRQNGYTIYSTNVAPGPFAISDIYPSNLSGDLHVTVIEADGTKNSFIVPYASVPNMIRQGQWQYQLTAGTYQNGFTAYTPDFIEATVSHGTRYDLTPYGGIIVAENYRAGVTGLSKSLGSLGALSSALSFSETHRVAGDSKTGTAMKLMYAKSLAKTGTEFKLTGYRYPGSGYYEYADAVAERDRWENGRYRNIYWDNRNYYDDSDTTDSMQAHRHVYYTRHFPTRRQKVDVYVNQQIAGKASVFINASGQSYWGASGIDRSLQIGLNNSFRDVVYGLFIQDTQSNHHDNDRSCNLSVSVPFNVGKSRTVMANFSASHNKADGNGFNSGASGSLLDDNRLSYSVQTANAQGSSLINSANLGYQGSIGNVDAGYSYGGGTRQETLGLAGGIVAHSGGITLTQPLQNTFILVEAKNARGTRLENQPGAAIDPFGYAVMTSAVPYHHNRVALRTADIKNGVDIPNAVKDIVPTYGAIGRIKYDTFTGQSLLIHSTHRDGIVPPLGAAALSSAGISKGIVGTNGDIFISGANAGERILVKWGEGKEESCHFLIPDLRSKKGEITAGYRETTLVCAQN